MSIDMTTVKEITHNNKDVVKIEDSNGNILWQKQSQILTTSGTINISTNQNDVFSMYTTTSGSRTYRRVKVPSSNSLITYLCDQLSISTTNVVSLTATMYLTDKVTGTSLQSANRNVLTTSISNTSPTVWASGKNYNQTQSSTLYFTDDFEVDISNNSTTRVLYGYTYIGLAGTYTSMKASSPLGDILTDYNGVYSRIEYTMEYLG